MRQYNVRLPEETIQRVQSTSNETGRNRADLIRDAIDYYLDNELWKAEGNEHVADSIASLAQRIAALEEWKDGTIQPAIQSDIQTNERAIQKAIQPATNVNKITPTVRDVLKVIKSYFDQGIEPMVSDVAKSVGMNTRSMGILLGKAGIHAKNTTRKSRVSRYFTFDMGEEIDKLLVE